MTLVEFSMAPVGKGESVSRHVARAVRIVAKSGLDYRLGPMGTCVEGEWDEVFAVIRKCWKALARDCGRISVAIKVDYRKGAAGRLRSKIESVERHLGRKVRT